jgi:hypothetical protein
MSDVVLTALGVGAVAGGWVGYQVGQWRAATRAAKNTYRSVRGR